MQQQQHLHHHHHHQQQQHIGNMSSLPSTPTKSGATNNIAINGMMSADCAPVSSASSIAMSVASTSSSLGPSTEATTAPITTTTTTPNTATTTTTATASAADMLDAAQSQLLLEQISCLISMPLSEDEESALETYDCRLYGFLRLERVEHIYKKYFVFKAIECYERRVKSLESDVTWCGDNEQVSEPSPSPSPSNVATSSSSTEPSEFLVAYVKLVLIQQQ